MEAMYAQLLQSLAGGLGGNNNPDQMAQAGQQLLAAAAAFEQGGVQPVGGMAGMPGMAGLSIPGLGGYNAAPAAAPAPAAAAATPAAASGGGADWGGSGGNEWSGSKWSGSSNNEWKSNDSSEGDWGSSKSGDWGGSTPAGYSEWKTPAGYSEDSSADWGGSTSAGSWGGSSVTSDGDKGKGKKGRPDWLCPNCGDKQFARNEKCRHCETFKPAYITSPEMAEQLKEGTWICPGCGDTQELVKMCKTCGTAQPKYKKVEVMSKVATSMVKNAALCYNWQQPWAAKEIGGFTSSGKQLGQGETFVCSVHGKRRSVRNMVEDGSGGHKCAEGQECVVSAWSEGGRKAGGKGKGLWMPGTNTGSSERSEPY